jgi:16S rRNA (guanine966-N2)-methyltransferase
VNRPPGHVRIIAGTLRGSKLPVADVPGLRPTGDRARETLFNWLQGEIAGKRALDLFAGAGALGFEAASRGAIAVTLWSATRHWRVRCARARSACTSPP